MIPQWQKLEREARIVILLAAGFVIYRTALASLSGFGFHQGWNEGHYALIAKGFLDQPLVPHYADRYVYSVPPLFPYTVAATFSVFGPSVLAARLPSILAGGTLIIATYALGKAVFEDPRTALTGAIILAVLPYFQLYSGRVQTDMLMICLLTGGLASIVRGYQRESGHRKWLVLGGTLFSAAVAAKQPALLLPGIVLAWLLWKKKFNCETVRRTGLLIVASAVFLIPLVSWLALNYSMHPTAFVADWQHELFARTKPFANVPLVLVIGLGLGATPLVLLGAAIGIWEDLIGGVRSLGDDGRVENGFSPLAWWLLLYGAFVLYRTPHGHQYYALVLMPPIALFAASGIRIIRETLGSMTSYRPTVIHLSIALTLLLSVLSGTVVLFELSGEFSVAEGGGTQIATNTGEFVKSDVSDNATVLVENGYTPPLMWYIEGEFPLQNIQAYHVGELDEAHLREMTHARSGPVYIVAPRPSWEDLPTEHCTAVYRSPQFEFTVIRTLGARIQTNSKFRFYLNDRRLTVYRCNVS